MKKSIIKVIVAILVLALLAGGYWFAVKWEPKPEKQENDSQTASPAEDIYLIKVNTDDIKSVLICEGTDCFTLVNGEKPYIEGYSSAVLSESSIKSAISSIGNVYASHKIKNPSQNFAEYGLDKRDRYVEITLNDGTKRTYIVGNAANYNDEYYACEEGKADVYTVKTYAIDSMFPKYPEAFRDLSLVTFDNTQITEFSVADGSGTLLAFKLNEKKKDENEQNAYSTLNAYLIAEGEYKGCGVSGDALSALFEKLIPPTADSIEEENPSNLAKYGLNPGVTVSITDGDGKHTIRLGSKTEDGSVYLMCDGKNVVYKAQCAFYDDVVNIKATDYLDRFIHIFNIGEIKNITVDFGNKKHSLSIKGDTEKEGDAVFSIDGKKVNEADFKNIYQNIIGITLANVADNRNKGEKLCTITFAFKDKTKKSYSYYKYDERYAVVKSDSGIECITLIKNLDKLKKALK